MSLKISRTTRFKKDFKLMHKQGKRIKELETVMIRLAKEESLEPKYKDHELQGKYSDRRECHIRPDWLLIYKLSVTEIIFERTGSHSDLFRSS